MRPKIMYWSATRRSREIHHSINYAASMHTLHIFELALHGYAPRSSDSDINDVRLNRAHVFSHLHHGPPFKHTPLRI